MKANVKESKCYLCPRTPVTYVPNLYTSPTLTIYTFGETPQEAVGEMDG